MRVTEQLPNDAAATGRSMAVTFDDLPLQAPVRDRATTRAINRKILDTLVARRVPATGFVNEQPLHAPGGVGDSLLEMWLDAGMELGNHTFSHADLHLVPPGEYFEEITRGESVTRRVMEGRGRPLRYFRHPHLHTGDTVETRRAVDEFLSRRGYAVAPVTVPGHEWLFAQVYDKAKFENEPAVMQYVAATYVPYMESCVAFAEEAAVSLFGRDIPHVLLLHAGVLNADYLDDLIKMLRGRGYSFLPLADVLADEVYSRPETYVGPFGLSWLQRWAATEGRQLAGFPREPETLLRLHAEAGL
jgi:peptidoglycan/xylan/chitin deacetylase (PgdA/CDA1 family)